MSRRTYKAERGAALVLALLIMLILSGLGMVAMKAATDSTTMAGMHRLQTQTKSVSDGVNQLGVTRSGRQASAYHSQMTSHAGGVSGVDFDAEDASDERHGEAGYLRRGGYVLFSSDDPESGGDAGFGLADNGADTVLDGAQFESVESDETRDLSFQYIVRDPVIGPRAPGFGEEYCFIRVTIGSSANIGNVATEDGDDDESDARQRAQRAQALGRNVSHSMIGPVECN